MIDPTWFINSDCSGLIPPCWQEIHYLYAGLLIGGIAALPLYELLRRRWRGRV